MKRRTLLMVGLFLSLMFVVSSHAQVAKVYYHVGMNKAPGGIIPLVNVFCPFGGVVNFRFVDYTGAEHTASIDCRLNRSQASTLEDLVPSLPDSVYFVEISSSKFFGVNLTDESNGALIPHAVLCRIQGIAQEISSTSDDYFRLYSETDAAIQVFNENLDLIGTYELVGGVPVIVLVPQGPSTSYVLQSSTPFAASVHDLPDYTGVLQCGSPNEF
jgi:hypothetical protein